MVIKTLDNASGSAGGLRQMTGALAELGVPCRVVARKVKRRVDDPVLEGIEVVRLPARNSFSFYPELRRWLEREAATYDVVHVHGIGALSFAAARAMRRVKKPLIVLVTSAGDKSRLGSWERWTRRLPFLKRVLGRHVDAWVSISSETRRGIEAVGADSKRIVDIPYGVNLSIFRPLNEAARADLRREFGVDEAQPVFVTVGRLKWRKRVDRTIAAFERVHREMGGQLWIIGDGPDRAQLESLAAQTSCADAIHFLGQQSREDVAARMRAADVFVLPSEVEGLSNAVLEAMAAGLPCVVSKISGNENLITSGVHGTLVERGDDETLVKSLLELARDTQTARRMGEAGRQKCEQMFGMESVARRLLMFYRLLLNGEKDFSGFVDESSE